MDDRDPIAMKVRMTGNAVPAPDWRTPTELAGSHIMSLNQTACGMRQTEGEL